ncbi:MAG: HypC/HybG/HupF family hydrogenase formation chaperone [Sedimentisphaerales bacterium]|nr:HypC/HybG/HupF family hydrogenase formation chaperone [Sedimentisphaerales bacterium]
MCIGVAGKVIELAGQGAVVDVEGNRVSISAVLAPEVTVGDYVLIHAGFAISIISEEDYQEQKKIFEEIDEHYRKTFESG